MEGSRPGFTAIRRQRWLCLAGLLFVGSLLATDAVDAAKLRISNRYSPLNRERQVRRNTDFIILHTTEGGDRPSLERIRRGGLAHYVVMRDGRVHRVISRKRLARHAGRSMWNGVQNMDHHSIGIEVIGYHNKPLKDAQITALAELLRQLQSIYGIPDDHVLTHSMVAYGKRNRWHKHAHRGRKRCGMQFASPALRQRLGLESRVLSDPDVAAGRLIVGDPYLAMVLYQPDDGAAAVLAQAEFAGPGATTVSARRSAWFIAREAYDDPSTIYVFPSGRKRRGDEINDWSRLPTGTRVLLGQAVPAPTVTWRTLGRDGNSAIEIAGAAYADGGTLYVRPNGRIQCGNKMTERDFRRLPPGTRVFVGFEYAGKVTSGTTAYDLCGPAFRRDSTLYLLPSGRVKTGDQISENLIPGGTHILTGS